ncbi:uncharacterized protein ARMOST_21688 [Armillaria ostoyae]|uniref:Uncharacterized protein n=1 Tax=Armillaria ostoyae TaxID=47428 RepID=A0A284SAX4_ARMOS|nr:uncharacterized protein ARMOST_21688 [Armillaria ostoyae]
MSPRYVPRDGMLLLLAFGTQFGDHPSHFSSLEELGWDIPLPQATIPKLVEEVYAFPVANTRCIVS